MGGLPPIGQERNSYFSLGDDHPPCEAAVVEPADRLLIQMLG
jgi:hypothetical protein